MDDTAMLAPLLQGIAWLLCGIFLLLLAGIANSIHAYPSVALVVLACGAALQGMVFMRALPRAAERQR